MTRHRAGMCSELGLSRSTIDRRLRSGVSLFAPKPPPKIIRPPRGAHWAQKRATALLADVAWWSRAGAILDRWAASYYGDTR